MTLLYRTRVIAALLAAGVVAPTYGAGDDAHGVRIMPEDIKWIAPAAMPGLNMAWLVGGEDTPGLYELRVRLAQGTIVPPHTHPDSRCATVLSGELYAGVGSEFAADTTRKYPPGSFHCVPAGVPHYVWAKNGEVVFQDSGVAPTGTTWVKK